MLSDKHEIMLIEKLKDLPPEKLAEVEDFVDFLRERGEARKFTHASALLSEPAFAKAWDNDSDAEHDRL